MLVIHPDESIDCGVCEPECPKPDTEPGIEKWLEINAHMLRCGRTSPSNESRRQMPRTGRASLTRPSYCRQILEAAIEPRTVS